MAVNPAKSLRVRQSVVREGALVAHILAKPDLAELPAASLALTVNGTVVAECPPPSPGQEATLSGPLPALEIAIQNIGVELIADGERHLISGDAAHQLPRLAISGPEDFLTQVTRKNTRIRDDETLLYAAHRSLRMFPGDIPILSVAASVIGYRYIEYPGWAGETGLRALAEQADALRATINDTVAEEARWAPTLDVMLYQTFAVHAQYPQAIRYLCRLVADRSLVHVEPICAYNLSLGVLMLGYLYFLQERPKEATKIWAAYEDLFVTAAVRQPKRLGTIREFGFIQRNSLLCCAGTYEAKHSEPAPGVGLLTDARIATQVLRSTQPEAQQRMQAFMAAGRDRKFDLPPADDVLASTPSDWA